MARNKRPALTSPWKIGFLVSLLLVGLSIGVGFFITRSFGLTWSWIEFQGSWKSFAFHRDSFMTEMLPLAVLVPLFSLIAYFAVTGAVRRHKGSSDSGADYKRLIKSIKKIKDIQDEGQINGLKNYPEMHTFLLTLRSSVMEREKALDARETALNDRDTETPTHDTLNADTDILVSAVLTGRDGGLDHELALTSPDLKRVEKAIRDNLLAPVPSDAEARMNELRTTLAASYGALGAKLEEIRGEVAEGEQGAREMETELNALRSKSSISPGDTVGASAAESERAVSRLDSISEVLNTLGEETRSVAINTALKASSIDETGESVVQLADDVRDLAAKFNGVAAQWEEASAEAHRAFTPPPGNGRVDVDESIEKLSGKIGLWVERTVLLSEKLKSFEQHYDESFSTLNTESDKKTDETPEMDQAQDWEIETNEPVADAAPDLDAADVTDPSEVSLGLDSPPEALAATDTVGFEKQEGLFAEMSQNNEPAEDEMFTDIPPAGEKEIEPPIELEPVQPVGPEPVDNNEFELGTPAPTPPPAEEFEQENHAEPVVSDSGVREYIIDGDSDDMDTTTSIEDVISGPSLTDKLPAAEPTTEPLDAPMRRDEDAIDLYELGAEDYEPENVHHNA